jgi:hypothetical protein
VAKYIVEDVEDEDKETGKNTATQVAGAASSSCSHGKEDNEPKKKRRRSEEDASASLARQLQELHEAEEAHRSKAMNEAAEQLARQLQEEEEDCMHPHTSAYVSTRQHTSAYVEEEDSMHRQHQDTGGNPRAGAGTQRATGEEKMNKSAVAPQLPLTATECGAYDFRMSNGQVLDVEEKESALCLGNAWTKVEQRVFIEKLADFACRPEEDALRKNFCTPLSSPPPLCPPPLPSHSSTHRPVPMPPSLSLSLRFSSASYKKENVNHSQLWVESVQCHVAEKEVRA